MLLSDSTKCLLRLFHRFFMYSFNFTLNVQDFTINTYLVQEWMDPRLKYNATFKLPPTSSLNDKVWLPDLIFFNAKFATLHDVTLENRVVQIQPDGEVCLYQRYTLSHRVVLRIPAPHIGYLSLRW